MTQVQAQATLMLGTGMQMLMAYLAGNGWAIVGVYSVAPRSIDGISHDCSYCRAWC